MGNTTSEFDIICVWIDDYDTNSTVRGGRKFITKYGIYRTTYTLSSYKDYITAIKKDHPIPKEISAINDEFIRIWCAIETYNVVVAKHNAITHRDDIRRSFYTKYTASSAKTIHESIISGRQLLLQRARDRESAAERAFVAARDARIAEEKRF